MRAFVSETRHIDNVWHHMVSFIPHNALILFEITPFSADACSKEFVVGQRSCWDEAPGAFRPRSFMRY